MQINLPYKAKQELLNVLRHYIPVDIEKFTGEVVVPLREGEINVVKYIGHVQVKYTGEI